MKITDILTKIRCFIEDQEEPDYLPILMNTCNISVPIFK